MHLTHFIYYNILIRSHSHQTRTFLYKDFLKLVMKSAVQSLTMIGFGCVNRGVVVFGACPLWSVVFG